VPRFQLPAHLVRHDPEHNRIESLPVKFIQNMEKVPLHAAEGVSLHVVGDANRDFTARLDPLEPKSTPRWSRPLLQYGPVDGKSPERALPTSRFGWSGKWIPV
jgi:hypothetical protein